MFVHKHVRCPTLERLEDRWVPATIRLVAGNLFISNQTGPLTVTATATPGKFDVNDNGKLVTVSGVGSLIALTGTNRADTINFKLAGNKFGGDLVLNTGNGNDVVSISGGGAGVIGGNITALTGNGIDVVNLGQLKVGGNSTFDLGLGGNNATFSGDQVGLTGLGTPVTFGGSVGIRNADNVFSDIPCNVGGDLTVSGDDGFANSWRLGVNVSGNASFTSGNTADLVRLNENGSIAGNLNVNLGGGNDTYEQGSGIAVTGTFNVNGSATVDLGEGDSKFFVGKSTTGGAGGATVAGNLTLVSGSGNNSYELSASAVIGGNLLVQAGNGVNDLAARPVLAAIAGNASFYLGNGNNLVTLGATSSIGGVLNVVTGNGDNTLTLAASQTYVVNAIFGSGNDTLVLGDGASTPTLTGYVNAGGGSNTLTVNSGTLAPDLTLIGF